MTLQCHGVKPRPVTLSAGYSLPQVFSGDKESECDVVCVVQMGP